MLLIYELGGSNESFFLIHMRLSNDIIDIRLLQHNPSIKRIGDVKAPGISRYSTAELQCLICNYKWLGRIDAVANGRSGCAQCAGKLHLNDQIIEQRLLEQQIPIQKLDNDIKGNQTKFSVRCLNCNYIWKTTANNIFSARKGCPKCNDQRLNNDIVDARLKDRPIIRLGNYINNHKHIKFKCTQCEFEWMAQPQHIFNGTGCPVCAVSGQNEKLLFSLLSENNFSFEREVDIRQINDNVIYKYRLDFYLPTIKLAIEYNGKQHYTPSTWGKFSLTEAQHLLEKQRERDGFIDTFCKINNISIIWIDGRIYYGNKLKKYYNEYVLPYIVSLTK